jgi:hypothetical protein
VRRGALARMCKHSGSVMYEAHARSDAGVTDACVVLCVKSGTRKQRGERGERENMRVSK